VWKEVAGVQVSTADLKLLVSGKHTGLKKCTSKNGKRFTAVFIMNRDGKLDLRFPENKLQHPAKAGAGKE
jgi:hypothetical protein